MSHDKNLPEYWKKELKDYCLKISKRKRDYLECGDFSKSWKINFEDGSFAFFDGAISLFRHKINEVLVLTEHCGYHIFDIQGNEFYTY